jgi:TP901 family phage tail tape measure protein
MANGTSEVGLGLTFSARDLASGPIGLLGNNFQSLRQGMARGMPQILGGFAAMAGGLATLGAGIEAFRGAFNLATVAGEFETEMAAVRTISGATTEEFNALAEAATQAGLVTQFAPAEAAGGLRVLSQQGLIAQDAIEGLVPVLDFAAAGNLSVAEAAEVAMGTMNAYGMTVDNMTSVTDRLMRGTQLSALSSNEFITVIGRAAATGNIFGTALDDVIIALGSMRSSGIPATVATTSLSEAMRRLATDDNAREELQRFGISAADSAGNLRSVIDVSRDLQVAMEGLTEAEQAQTVNRIFGVRGMQEFAAIANIQARVMRNGEVVTLQGAEAIAHYRRELEDAGGTTEQFRRDRLATFAGQMTLLEGSVQTFQTAFGRTFGVIFRPIMIAVTEALNVVTNAWNNLSESTQRVLAVIGLGGASFAIVSGFLMTVGGGLVVLIGLLGELALVAAAVAGGILLAMLPVVLIFAAAGAAAFALYRAYQENLGGIGDFVNQWVGRIQLAWTALTEIVTGDSFSEAVRQQFGMAQNEGVREFVLSLRDLIRRAQAVWRGFQDTFAEVWANMGPVFEELKGAFTELFTEVHNVFGGLVEGGNAMPFEQFESFGAMLAHTVGGALRWLIGAVTSLVRAGRWLVQTFQAVVNSPITQFALGLVRVTLALVGILWKIISFFGRIQQMVSRGVLGAVWDIITGIPTAAAVRTPAGEVQEQGNPAQELTRDRREREQQDRTEASVARPAAADAANRREESFDLEAAIAGSPRAGGTRTVENQVNLRLDRDVLSSVIQELNLDDETSGGGVVTDEFGFTPAAAG